jgi:hypothetical protein
VANLSIKYPRIADLKSAFSAGKISLDEIRMIAEILDKSDSKAFTAFDKDIERFTKMVQDCLPIKGIRWDDIILRFEWSYEAEKIRSLIDDK